MIALYTLNLDKVIYQLYFSKAGEKIKQTVVRRSGAK